MGTLQKNTKRVPHCLRAHVLPAWSRLVSPKGSPGNTPSHAILKCFAASCCYAMNIHFIKIHLAQVEVMAITLGNFVFMAPAAFVVLMYSDFFSKQTFSHPEIYPAIGYITILALAGSAFAKYLFNKFVKITSAVFASSVTYTLPVVALFWGVYDGEVITQFQLLSTALILVGVYLSHTKKAA